MDIYEEIKIGQDKVNDAFKKALPSTLNEMVEDIKKAKAAQIGEIRTWSGVKMRKEANGWVPVKEGGGGKGKEEEGKIKEAGPEDLLEHARNASETALMNATKVSGDPAVREAAHKELMRRKSEEAQETFKSPGDGVKTTESVAKEAIASGSKEGAKKVLDKDADDWAKKKNEELKKKEEPKKEEKKPEAKKEDKEEKTPFEKKMEGFRKEMKELGEKITNYKTQKEFDDFMLQIKAVTSEMKAAVATEMKSQGDKLVKEQEGKDTKATEKKEEGNKDKMLNEYGVHKGIISLKNNGHFTPDPQFGDKISKEVTDTTSVSSEEEKAYLSKLPVHKMDEVPKKNPDGLEDNYVIETSDGTKYLVDTQGYDYPRYMTKLVAKF